MNISIVMPAYNGSRFLSATLESVLAQTLPTWELVVVDDGSTDDTFALASSYAERDRRIRVLCQPNGGVATARNRGYSAISASSEAVVFLDHDDVWHPDALSVLSSALASHPEAVAAHGMARMTDLQGQPYGSPEGTIMSWNRRKLVGGKIMICSRSEPTTFSLLICDCCLCTPGIVLIRRAISQLLADEETGLFDQNVAPGDDWDLWLRLSILGDFCYVDEVVLNWRQHESNGSRDEEVTHAAESRVRRKIISLPSLTQEQQFLARYRFRRVYASVERHNARDYSRWAWAHLCGGRLGLSVKMLRLWRAHYQSYLTARLAWSAQDYDRAIPKRWKTPAL